MQRCFPTHQLLQPACQLAAEPHTRMQGAAEGAADGAKRAWRRKNQSEESKEKERARNRRAQVCLCLIAKLTSAASDGEASLINKQGPYPA